MPYIKKEKRDKIIKDPNYIGDVGDLNFAYSSVYKDIWLKEKGYKTIEFIAGIGMGHTFPQFILELDRIVARHGFNEQELIRAKFLAFLEFMRRVGNYYEDDKIIENGDIYYDVEEAVVEIPVPTLNPNASKRGRKKDNGK